MGWLGRQVEQNQGDCSRGPHRMEDTEAICIAV